MTKTMRMSRTPVRLESAGGFRSVEFPEGAEHSKSVRVTTLRGPIAQAAFMGSWPVLPCEDVQEQAYRSATGLDPLGRSPPLLAVRIEKRKT